MYKFTAKEKYNVLKVLRSTPLLTVCRRYKVNRTTIWRWKRKYDGSVESLEPNFSRKNIHHPTEQTTEEKKHIFDLVRRNPHIGLNELYGKLYRDYIIYLRIYALEAILVVRSQINDRYYRERCRIRGVR